jgi:hypothetical protein
MTAALNLQNLENFIYHSLPAPNMTIAEAASELTQSLERDFNPVVRAFSHRRNYRRAIVMLNHVSPNFRDVKSIADCLLSNNVVNSPHIALELAPMIQVELMTFDFAELECLREQTNTKEVKEFEQWTLKQARDNHCPYK